MIELSDGEDALTQLCRQYVYRGQCPRTMNMAKVYGRKQYVNDIAKEYGADGIVYEQIKFCDPWAYERLMGSTMLRDDSGYPVLSARCARACRPLWKALRSRSFREVRNNGYCCKRQRAHR